MGFLKEKIASELSLTCFFAGNNSVAFSSEVEECSLKSSELSFPAFVFCVASV